MRYEDFGQGWGGSASTYVPSRHINREMRPLSIWVCEYCKTANLSNMLECRGCSASYLKPQEKPDKELLKTLVAGLRAEYESSR